jgi:hypothetical protein
VAAALAVKCSSVPHERGVRLPSVSVPVPINVYREHPSLMDPQQRTGSDKLQTKPFASDWRRSVLRLAVK